MFSSLSHKWKFSVDSASLKAKIKTNTKTKETWIFSSHSKRPPQPQQSHCLLSQLASLDLTLTLCFINTYSRRKKMLQMRRHITSWLIGLFANTSPVWITIMVNFNISIQSLFSVISNLPNWMLIKRLSSLLHLAIILCAEFLQIGPNLLFIVNLCQFLPELQNFLSLNPHKEHPGLL